jgi:hypothetical protein
MSGRRVAMVAAAGCLSVITFASPARAASPAKAKEITVQANVTSAKGYPLTVGELDTARLSVNLHQQFRSVSKLCMTFYTSPDDPLAYRDTMQVTEATATNSSQKFHLTIYNYDEPHTSDTFCDPYFGANRLVDGKAQLKLWGGWAATYDNGAATFLRITISVTGPPR